MMLCTSSHDNVLRPSAPASWRGSLFFELMTQRLSVSQNKYVPLASATQRSSMASSNRPPAAMSEPKIGLYHLPGSSISLEASSCKCSPEKTPIVVDSSSSFGFTSTKRPYEPE